MKTQHLFATAVAAVIGLAACDVKKVEKTPEPQPKENAKPAETKPAPAAEAKPKAPAPAEDEVVNVPPDEAPAPVK